MKASEVLLTPKTPKGPQSGPFSFPMSKTQTTPADGVTIIAEGSPAHNMKKRRTRAPGGGAPRKRKSGRSVSFYLSSDVHEHLKARAQAKKESISDMIEREERERMTTAQNKK